MATPYLHGNGKPCPKCDATGMWPLSLSPLGQPCKTCKGTGRKPRKTKDIVREACRPHWPAQTESTTP